MIPMVYLSSFVTLAPAQSAAECRPVRIVDLSLEIADNARYWPHHPKGSVPSADSFR